MKGGFSYRVYLLNPLRLLFYNNGDSTDLINSTRVAGTIPGHIVRQVGEGRPATFAATETSFLLKCKVVLF